MDELNALQEDVLNERLAEADHVPVHIPPGATRAPEGTPLLLLPLSSNLHISHYYNTARQPVAVEDDEDAQLRELQAAMSM
jgi:charged multivesicular body protein 4